MRSFTVPLPTLFAGFVAVLVGYASSAAIIWQAAAAAGATPGQIAGWMTALGLAMGVSTLALSGWRKVPVLTAWSTPGAALLVSGLQGVTLAEAVGIFIFANALIVICGATGLFARLMKIIPHSLAAAMLAGLLNLGRSETAGGRVETWIDLWTKPQTEKPIDQLTDTERSMIAIHNGGILGEGAGQSAMRVEMIHPESDYAYAFFVEEYGIVLALLLLLLYLWIFFRAIEIFRRCGTAFPGLLVLGLALLITCQALLHIMVTVNLIPETGQTLPLISRGGSSTIFTAIALGMILSVSRQNDEQSHDMPKSESIYEK